MKYTVTRTDGTPIPPDEPCFVIRAQDLFAIKAVQAYIDLTRDLVRVEMTRELIAHRERIAHWQLEHRPKLPD
jgi:hypothetical protein